MILSVDAIERDNRQSKAPSLSGRQTLTVEHGLYALIVVTGVIFRFVALGREPLAIFEAANSWPAWLAATYMPVPVGAPTPASALLFGTQSLLFFIAGSGDDLARLIPALFGVCIAFLPWFWRTQLGRVPALVAAALLAIDPWLVAASRRADDAALTIFFGLLVLTALWQWYGAGDDATSVRWQRIAAVAAGFLMVSGALAWSVLPVLLIAAAIFRPDGANGWLPGFRWSTVLWFFAAAALGATGFAFQPAAVGALSVSLTAWIAQFAATDTAGNGLNWLLFRLVIDSPFILTFGLLGLGIAWIAPDVTPAGRRLAWFLSAWLVWGLLLAALPGASPAVLSLLGLSLVIASGVAIGWLVEIGDDDLGGVEVALVLMVETVLLVAGVITVLRLVESQVFDEQLLLTVAIILGLLLVVWIPFVFFAGWRSAVKVAGLYIGVLFFLLTVRSSWLLSHGDPQAVRNGFFVTTTLADVRMLADDVQTLSIIHRGDPTEAEVQVVAAGQPNPVLGWYLRDMQNLRWVPAPETSSPEALSDPNRRPLVITPGDMLEDRDLSGYWGSRYHLIAHWAPAMLPAPPEQQAASEQGLPEAELARLRAQASWSQAIRPRLQWLLFRKSATPQDVMSVNLWAAP